MFFLDLLGYIWKTLLSLVAFYISIRLFLFYRLNLFIVICKTIYLDDLTKLIILVVLRFCITCLIAEGRGFVSLTISSSLVAPWVVVATTCGATGDGVVVGLTTLFSVILYIRCIYCT